MIKALVLASLVFLAGISPGCTTTTATSTPSPPASEPICSIEKKKSFDREICDVSHKLVDQITFNSKESADSGASNFKTTYQIEVCKRVLKTDKAFSIITFKQYLPQTVKPFKEVGILVDIRNINEKWVPVEVNLFYVVFSDQSASKPPTFLNGI